MARVTFKHIIDLIRAGDYSSALKIINRISVINLNIRDNIYYHHLFGEILVRQGDFINAAHYLFQCEKLALESSDNEDLLFNNYLIIRLLCSMTNQPKRAVLIANKIMDLAKKNKEDVSNYQRALRTLAISYIDVGKMKTAEKLFKEAYKLCKNNALFHEQFFLGNDLISYYTKLKNKTEAAYYVEINISLLKDNYPRTKSCIETFHVVQGQFLILANKPNEALQLSNFYLENNTVSAHIKLLFLDIKHEAYIQLNNYAEAYHVLKKIREIETENNNAEKQKIILETQSKYEVEKKESEINKLKELEETKARIFSNITHELRTPLTLISSPLHECLQYEIPSNCKEHIHTAIENSNQMLHLINQLLDISKLDSGLYKPVFNYGDIIQYINTLVNRNISSYSHKTIQLTLNHKISNIYSNFDEDKLGKIVTNLLSNAIKYSPSKCKIKIYTDLLTKENNNSFYFSINDYGMGISSEELPHIFDRFYRGEDNSIKQVIGSGIGLSLVKEFLDLLGGRIQVSSKYQKGTRVEIWVPISDVKFTQNSEISQINSEGNDSKKDIKLEALSLSRKKEKKLILIVEDNAEIAKFLSEIIQHDFDILFANNGKDGFKLTLQNIPDIVISDIMMPVTDGIEMTKMIKSNVIIAHTPVILLSAKSSQEVKNQARSAGADYYFSKPFHPLDIKLTLKNIILQTEKLQKLNDRIVLQGDFKEIEPNTFLNNVFSKVSKNYMNESFKVDVLAKEMNLSTSQFNKKFAKVCTLSPRILIESFRLHKAKEILVNDNKNVSEVAYEVGYKDVATFTRAFKRYFDNLPSDYKR